MFQDSKQGQTHSYGDGCIPAHQQDNGLEEDKDRNRKFAEFVAMNATSIIFNREAGWSGVLERMIAQALEQERTQATASANAQWREKIQGMRIDTDYKSPDYWNKGENTEERCNKILNEVGGLMEIYNLAIDDLLNS